MERAAAAREDEVVRKIEKERSELDSRVESSKQEMQVVPPKPLTLEQQAGDAGVESPPL